MDWIPNKHWRLNSSAKVFKACNTAYGLCGISYLIRTFNYPMVFKWYYDSMLLKKTLKKPTNSIRDPIKRYFHRCRRAFTIQYKTFCVQYPLCIYVCSYIMLYVKPNISLKFIALSLWKVCKYERELWELHILTAITSV